MSAPWEVAVWAGLPLETDRAVAPLVFGTSYVTVGHDPDSEGSTVSDLKEPIAYGPVFLRGDSTSISVQVQNPPVPGPNGKTLINYSVVRTMARPTFEFEWPDVIRAEGFEEGPDGRLVMAVWEIKSFRED